MTDLPNIGDKVHVWPSPGLRVQDGPRGLADGGRFLPAEGREVKWSYLHLEQLRSGELFLHDPRPAAPEKE